MVAAGVAVASEHKSEPMVRIKRQIACEWIGQALGSCEAEDQLRINQALMQATYYYSIKWWDAAHRSHHSKAICHNVPPITHVYVDLVLTHHYRCPG